MMDRRPRPGLAWIGMSLATLAAAFLCVPPTGAGQASSDPASGFPVLFDSERIQLAIVGDSLEITGTYHLLCRRPTEREIVLFYPFPRDSLLGEARMVALRAWTDGGTPVDGVWQTIHGNPGVRFLLPPCAGDTLTAEAVYRQRIRTRYARYIVTTTRAWARPLRRARFEIRLPEGAEPDSFSFPFQRVETEGRPLYVYEATDFLPDHDIMVWWN